MYHYWDGAPHVPGLLMDTTLTGLAMLDAYALLQRPLYLERAMQLGTTIVHGIEVPPAAFLDISGPVPPVCKRPSPC